MTDRKRYSLKNLVKQCDPDAPVSQDMIDWENAKLIGLEQTVMDNQVDIREAVLKFRELLSGEVTQLVLFGSRTRGDYRPDSDADVAVLLRGEPGDFVEMKLGLACLAYEVLLQTGVRIRPFPVWETEWCDPEKSQHRDTLEVIAREGITLWQA
ncbi:antitoxin ChpS [Marinobacter sp. LV10R510-11A]|uniref:nucleotidyltransferase domain-containing protein n=1 Tax=Marinobacter sp. LV10R510-11A TaxID=1415568 RepID=UPI000BB69502|nr:nucleotidyltransferase domain-containing protein [Marinobacter sp. LV10R510-11A]SOB74770.1 antitoxin ChpS [Marinobacter sp. LV10R510-11A]SOB74785.1 antitoxin ChpS [Marinobacter sp. LV10R510-11A]